MVHEDDDDARLVEDWLNDVAEEGGGLGGLGEVASRVGHERVDEDDVGPVLGDEAAQHLAELGAGGDGLAEDSQVIGDEAALS